MKSSHARLARNIFAALFLGTFLGYAWPQATPYVAFLGLIFKSSLSMIVMPVMVLSILGGMGANTNPAQLGDLSKKTLLYFASTTFIAVVIGLTLVTVIHPGDGHRQIIAQAAPATSSGLLGLLQDQITKILMNPFEALVQKNALAVILFAIVFGGILARMGEKSRPFFNMIQVLNEAIFTMVALIMRFAPLGVFGLIADVVASMGIGVFRELGLYAACVLLGLLIMLLGVLPGMVWLKTGISPRVFLNAIRPIMLVAFSTSSSKATLPIMMQCLEETLHVNKTVSRFVLPLSASMNMNGTALYEAVAAVFIAQLYGIAIDIPSQIVIALTASCAAIGAAGIPAAGTVTMALVLSAAGLPLEGIGLLLAIDRPLDMCRTMVNVVSDAACALCIHHGQTSTQTLPASTLQPTG